MERQSGVAEVNGTRLWYEAAGAGPALALIHGFALDARMWDDQVDALAQHYRVVRYDARGFGRSAVPTGAPYRHVDDLKALLDSLAIDRAVVVGLSMGGGIAIDFALTYPTATAALIAVDAVYDGFTTSAEWDAAVTPVWTTARARGVEAARPIWLSLGLFRPAAEQPALAARLAAMAADYSGWHWVNRDTHQALTPPAAQRLASIAVPTLIVLGERDLPDFHVMAATMHRQIPAAELAIVPGAGHMANMEAPARFNALVLDYLGRVVSRQSPAASG